MNINDCKLGILRLRVCKTVALVALVALGFLPVRAKATVWATASTEETQQSITVQGTVVDANGEPVIGANVLEKGTASNGSTTDINGHYTLTVRNAQSVLVVSYIGYVTQEITVGNQRTINVTLKEDAAALDEVVVIGYGTQRKGDITSAIASVKKEDFIQGKVGDAADLIKGKIAGLTIANGSGNPNDGPSIRLRGIISLEGSNSPLIIVDGIEGSMGTVAPENIESIDVLKDASAAAIYGTRAANGVIIITTTNGKREERTTASYSAYGSFTRIGKTLDFMGPAEIRAGLTDYVDMGYDTDWLDAITRTSFSHNHNFNIHGGSKSTSYSADATYKDDQGIILNTYSKDMTLNLNVSHWMMNDLLKVSINLLHSTHTNSATNAGDGGITNLYRLAVIHNPTEPIKNPDGSWFENFGRSEYFNPLSLIYDRTGSYDTDFTRMTGSVSVQPVKDWITDLQVSRRTSNAHNKGYYKSTYSIQAQNKTNGNAYHSYGKSINDQLELTTSYKKNIGQHRMEGMAGYSYLYRMNESFNASNTGFPNDFFEYNNLALGSYLKDGKAGMGSDKSDSKLIAFFGRVSYGFADKYNVLLSLRHEGSSRFGANNKWGDFWGASAGWTISQEEFMKDIKWINNLKLRLGVGQTGVEPGSNYLSLLTYDYGSQYYYDNGKWVAGLTPQSNPNPDLKWETSTEFSGGIDFSVLNNRLSGSIDLFNKTTTGMLWDYTVPVPPNLYGTTKANVGEMNNKGIEVLISAIPVQTKDFEWKTTLTGSHGTNKLVSLSNELYQTDNFRLAGGLGAPISQDTHYMEVGKPLGHFFAIKSVGVSERGVFLIENPNNGQIEELNDAMLDDVTYRQDLGTGLPQLYLGWGNQLRYKNFDLSMQFMGQFFFKIANEARAYYENEAVVYNKLKSVSEHPYGSEYKLSKAQKQTFVSYYLEDGDFLKLTNLTLGYTVPLKDNKYVKGIRAYVSGNNLFCLTGYKGLDPELSNWSVTAPGVEYRDKYPTTRSFTFGLNVSF